MMCGFDGCEKPAYRSSKLCTGHRAQKQRGQELRPLMARPPVEGDCRFIGCDRPARTRGLCAGHYNQLNRGVELKPLDRPREKSGPDVCTFPDCGKPSYSHGLCSGHNSQRKRGQELRPIRVTEKKADRPKRETRGVCSFSGCDRPHEAHGLCLAHYKQHKRGQELRPITPRAPRKAAPPPPTDPGFTWTPGTLWPELEKAEMKRPSTLTRDIDPATLLHTSVLIPDETKAACREVLAGWGALDLAECLGVAS